MPPRDTDKRRDCQEIAMSADDLQRPSPELAEAIRAFVTDGVDAAQF